MENARVSELARAIEAAFDLGTENLDAIRLILEHRREAPIPLFSLDGHPHLKPFAIELPDLTAYSTLTEQGA